METSKRSERDECLDGTEHIWCVARDHDHVHCARCLRCLAVHTMLQAYVTLHGGKVRRE